MMQFQSKPYFQAMSNTERQRQFRERNPGYYGRLHRKRKAEMEAYAAARQTEQRAAVQVTEEVKTPLALPAPAIVFTFEGINAIPTTKVESREAVIIPRDA